MQPLPAVPQSTQGRTGFSSLARLVIRGGWERPFVGKGDSLLQALVELARAAD